MAARCCYFLAQANPEELKNTFATVAPSPAALMETTSVSATGWDKNVINARHSGFETEYAQTLHCEDEGVASDFVLASGNWGSL
jgi:hypothetical protein